MRELVHESATNRATCSTSMNRASSRSHALLLLRVEQANLPPDEPPPDDDASNGVSAASEATTALAVRRAVLSIARGVALGAAYVFDVSFALGAFTFGGTSASPAAAAVEPSVPALSSPPPADDVVDGIEGGPCFISRMPGSSASSFLIFSVPIISSTPFIAKACGAQFATVAGWARA